MLTLIIIKIIIYSARLGVFPMKDKLRHFFHNNKLLLKLSLPMFLESILNLLIGATDKVMVGNDFGASAISNAGTIVNILLISFSVLANASVILITQYQGAKDKDQENRIYSVAFYLNLAISLIISLILFTCSDFILTLMNVAPEIKQLAIIYIQITGGFIFLSAISSTLSAFLRSNRLIKQGLLVSAIMNVINIIGNALLVNGFGPIPAMGIAGIAWASTASRLIGVIVLFILYMKHIGIKFSIKCLKPFPFAQIKKLFHIGIPTAGESFSYSMSQIVILGFVNLIGTVAISTKSYVSILATSTYIFSYAIAQGAQVIIGRQIGAKQTDEVDKQVRDTAVLGAIVTLCMSIIVYLFSDQIFGLLSDNPEVVKLGKTIMFIDIFLEIGRALNLVLVRCLQTTGDIHFPTSLAIVFCWAIAVGLGYVFGIKLGLGLAGIWIAMAIDEVVRAIIFIFRWGSGKWRRYNLIK